MFEWITGFSLSKKCIQLKGCIESYDDDTLILKSDVTLVVVYKHAISTVMPNASSQAFLQK